MSQQALSTSIRQFERELGVTLLERITCYIDLVTDSCGSSSRGRSKSPHDRVMDAPNSFSAVVRNTGASWAQ
jgi:hypothetical protein